MRSPTAERIFADMPGIETASAGLSPLAEDPATPEAVEWADEIIVMEPEHRELLEQRFGSRVQGKPLIVLNIPDRYEYMDPELIRLLKERVGPRL